MIKFWPVELSLTWCTLLPAWLITAPQVWVSTCFFFYLPAAGNILGDAGATKCFQLYLQPYLSNQVTVSLSLCRVCGWNFVKFKLASSANAGDLEFGFLPPKSHTPDTSICFLSSLNMLTLTSDLIFPSFVLSNTFNVLLEAVFRRDRVKWIQSILKQQTCWLNHFQNQQ